MTAADRTGSGRHARVVLVVYGSQPVQCRQLMLLCWQYWP